MENNKQNIKMILYPILYWIIFIIIPFIVAYNMKDYNRALNISGVIMFYILFIAPFLYFIPYRLVKIINSKQKLVFILAGLVIPYVIFYVYIITQIINAFNNSRFPF